MDEATLIKYSIKDVQSMTNIPQKNLYIARNAPFVSSIDDIGKLSGIYNGKESGHLFLYSTRVLFSGQELSALVGSDFRVDKEARKSGLGLMIPEYWVKCGDIIVIGNISPMATPIYKYFKFHLFEIPKFVSVTNSKLLLGRYICGFSLSILASICDIPLKLLKLGYKFFTKIHFCKFCVIEKDLGNADLDGIEAIINEDNSKYKELHNAKWLEWVLKYKNGEDRQRLYEIYCKGDLCGFYIIKHCRINQLGFTHYKKPLENLLWGELIEWGVKKGTGLTPQILFALALGKSELYYDVLEMASENRDFFEKIPHFIMRQYGFSNFAVRLSKDHKKQFQDYDDINMWRVRMGVGDNCI